MTTKAKLLTLYERELRERYEWTKDADKLANFMDAAREMLDGGRRQVDRAAPSFRTALKQAGLPMDITLKGLIALPAGE
jgi:hypothetical protein